MLLFLCTILYVDSCGVAVPTLPTPPRREGMGLAGFLFSLCWVAWPFTHFTCHCLCVIGLFLSFILLTAFSCNFLYLVLFGLSEAPSRSPSPNDFAHASVGGYVLVQTAHKGLWGCFLSLGRVGVRGVCVQWGWRGKKKKHS
jgi:hypothetical protein